MKTAARRPVQTSAPSEEDLALNLAIAAIANGLNGPPALPVGNHQARGTALLAVDAWVNQAADGERSESFPYKEVLGLTLALACPGHEKLLRLMEQAAAKALKAEKVDLAHVALALDAMKTRFLDKLERRPAKGRCTVTGQVKLIEFRERK